MSTRFTRTADKAQNEKNATILKGLLKENGNKFCADCRRKDPRWASWNLGIFVCIRCSGIHRSMGTHISKVKSVDLDSWIPDQVESMVKWGNERANLYWEANLKDAKPNESNMDMWIRSKYELKKWAMKGPIPDPSTLGGGRNSSVATESQIISPKAAAPKEPVKSTPKPKQTEFSSLDDFFGSSPSNSTTTTNNNAAVTQLQGADFFSSTPSTNNNTNTNTNTNTNEQPKQQQFDFKSSILSLYNQQPAATITHSFNNNNNQNQFMGQNNNNGNYQQQLFGLSSSNNNQQQQQSSIDNVWGSFVSSSATNSNTFTSTAPLQPSIQGSQFFNTSSSSSPQQPKKQPAHDVFADLLG